MVTTRWNSKSAFYQLNLVLQIRFSQHRCNYKADASPAEMGEAMSLPEFRQIGVQLEAVQREMAVVCPLVVLLQAAIRLIAN